MLDQQKSQRNLLQGKRYVNLIRCSTEKQAATSVKAQLRANSEFAKRNGMIHVMDIILEGVSGSKTFNRRDLERLIEEKRLKNSYDVILFRDFARLTRGGISHGHTIKRNFAQLGVELRSVMDYIPEGPMGEMMETFLFFQNQEYSRSLSRWLVQSLSTAVRAGRKPPGNRAVYGFDKMLMGPDGKPTRIVRWTPAMRYISHPETREVMETMPSHLHFQKHRFETYKYILGDPKQVDAIRWMYEQHYKFGVSLYFVTKGLNERKIPAARGGPWRVTCVQKILENPIYIGRAIAFQRTAALYYHPSSLSGFSESLINQLQLEGQDRWAVPQTRVPKEHWFETPFPEGDKMIVDPVVKARAAVRIQEVLDNWTTSRRPKRKTTYRNVQSTYFLRRVLRLKGFPDRPIEGKLTNFDKLSEQTPRRYYSVRNRDSISLDKDYLKLKKLIPAGPTERMIWEMVRETFADKTFVRRSVEQHVKRLIEERKRNSDRAAMERRGRKLQMRLDFLLKTLDEENSVRYEREVLNTQQELKQIKLQMTAAMQVEPDVNVQAVTKRVMEHFEKIPSGDTPLEVLERLELVVGSVVRRLDVDPLNFEVEVELLVPDWAMSKGGTPEDMKCAALLGVSNGLSCVSGIKDGNDSLNALTKFGPVFANFDGWVARFPKGRAAHTFRGPFYGYRRARNRIVAKRRARCAAK